jgi:hypothetical protein
MSKNKINGRRFRKGRLPVVAAIAQDKGARERAFSHRSWRNGLGFRGCIAAWWRSIPPEILCRF